MDQLQPSELCKGRRPSATRESRDLDAKRQARDRAGLRMRLSGLPTGLLRRDAVGAAAERAGAFDLLNLRLREAEHVAEDLLRVLAQERRTRHLGGRIRQLDRVADRDVF